LRRLLCTQFLPVVVPVISLSPSSTETNGLLSTVVVSSTSVYAAGSTITAPPLVSSSSSKTNVGAIAGGVIGGLALLCLLALLAVWYRGKRRFDEEFDGNFNPDRIANGSYSKNADGATFPRVDIGGADTAVTPFVTYPASAAPMAAPNVPSPLSQSNIPNTYQSGPSIVGNNMSPSGQSPSDHYATDYVAALGTSRRSQQSTEASGVGGDNEWRTVSPDPSIGSRTASSRVASSSSSGAGVPLMQGRNAKEREALGRYGSSALGGMSLATQVEESHDGSQYYQQGPGPGQQEYGVAYGSPGQPDFQPRFPDGFAPSAPYGSQGYFPVQTGPSRVSTVMVHEDAGRVFTKADEAQEDRVVEPPEEIPPTYDSIRK
jgi:hypothetical protein